MSKKSLEMFRKHVTGTEAEKDEAERWFDKNHTWATADELRKARQTGNYASAVRQYNTSYNDGYSSSYIPHDWNELTVGHVKAWKSGKEYTPPLAKAQKGPRRRKAREKTKEEIYAQMERISKELGRRGYGNNAKGTDRGRDEETGKTISTARAKQLDERARRVFNAGHDYISNINRMEGTSSMLGKGSKTSYRVGEYTSGQADQQRIDENKAAYEEGLARRREQQRARRAAAKERRNGFIRTRESSVSTSSKANVAG